MLDVLTLVARVFVGAQFVWMGWHKVAEPVEFLKLAREYQLLQSHQLLNLVAIVLPWFEVLCGLLLVAGVAVRGSALLVVTMLVPFTWMVTARAMGIQAAEAIPFCAVRFDCGCGGGVVQICAKLRENLLLLLLSGWVVVAPRTAWCLWPGVIRGPRPG